MTDACHQGVNGFIKRLCRVGLGHIAPIAERRKVEHKERKQQPALSNPPTIKTCDIVHDLTKVLINHDPTYIESLFTEKMTLLPQQNVLLIYPQQTSIVVVTISIVIATTVIVVVTMHIVVGTIKIVTTTILVC